MGSGSSGKNTGKILKILLGFVIFVKTVAEMVFLSRKTQSSFEKVPQVPEMVSSIEN